MRLIGSILSLWIGLRGSLLFRGMMKIGVFLKFLILVGSFLLSFWKVSLSVLGRSIFLSII